MNDIASALDRNRNGNGRDSNENTPPPYHGVPFSFPKPVFRAKKATTRKRNGKKGKGTAEPMSRMENNGATGRSGRTRKPSQKLIEAAEAAQEKAAKAVSKAEAAKARAAKATAAAAMVAQEGYHNDFAKMLRQSQLEGPQFSMGLPINLPKLPRRRGGKRRTVRRRR